MITAIPLLANAPAMPSGTAPVPQPHIGRLVLKTYRGPLYRQGKNIRVRIDIGVDGSGEVASCDVQSSSGSVENDRRLCAAMRRDARFKPATDASGAPIAGVFILRAAFFDGDREKGAPADKDPIVPELRIANLSVASSQKPVRFARIIAAQGAVEVCAPEEQEKLSSEDAAAACRGLAALPARRPLMNADGIPQRTRIIDEVYLTR